MVSTTSQLASYMGKQKSTTPASENYSWLDTIFYPKVVFCGKISALHHAIFLFHIEDVQDFKMSCVTAIMSYSFEVTVDTHTYKYTRLLRVDAYYGIHCKGSDMGVMYNEWFYMVKQLYYVRLKAEITM